jgi:hypothetical protein
VNELELDELCGVITQHRDRAEDTARLAPEVREAGAYGVSTTAVYATRNPVERSLRDLHALNAAFESFQSLRRAAGGVLLGHETRDPRF